MSNPSQLLLLCDHIKLSLLERDRATSLSLDPSPQADAQISRSLESLREGIESLSQRSSDTDQLSDLQSQYNELSRHFLGEASTALQPKLTSPNDPTLQADFAHARSRPQGDATYHSSLRHNDPSHPHNAKNVRFRDISDSTDSPEDADEAANRAALFPQRYTDDEPPSSLDPTTELSNQQIHEHHRQVLEEQDEQLDRLGESIGRQRHLSIQIGDELEGQVALLDEVDRGVDRHQTRLDHAKRRLKGVSNAAKRNWGMTTIVGLICLLVLLIIVLK